MSVEDSPLESELEFELSVEDSPLESELELELSVEDALLGSELEPFSLEDFDFLVLVVFSVMSRSHNHVNWAVFKIFGVERKAPFHFNNGTSS